MPSAESAEGTAAEAGDEALEGEAQDIRDNLIAGGAEILAEYPLGVLSLRLGLGNWLRLALWGRALTGQ